MINYNKLSVLYMDDIYAYIDIYKKDLIDNLINCDIDPLPNEIEDEAQLMIDNDYDDMLTLINTYDYKINYDYIEVVYKLGLWYGRREGKTRFKTLKEAVQSGSYDINIIYFKDKKSTLTKEATHHDGSNTYKYYKVVNGKKYAIKYNDLINIAI